MEDTGKSICMCKANGISECFRPFWICLKGRRRASTRGTPGETVPELRPCWQPRVPAQTLQASVGKQLQPPFWASVNKPTLFELMHDPLRLVQPGDCMGWHGNMPERTQVS